MHIFRQPSGAVERKNEITGSVPAPVFPIQSRKCEKSSLDDWPVEILTENSIFF